MASRSIDITFINGLNLELTRISSSNTHGDYTIQPPDKIEPGQKSNWKMESSGLLFTGAQGSAVYKFIHDNKDYTLNMSWDNPYIGTNSYSCSTNNKDYNISYTSSTGLDSSVTFKFSKANITTLWYTETNNIWHNSYPIIDDETLYPGHLVSYKGMLFCFYKSETFLDNKKNNIFYIKKEDIPHSWSRPDSIEKFGDFNEGLSVALYKDRILIACRNSDNNNIKKIKLISYYNNTFHDAIHYNIESSNDLSLLIFNNKIHLFFTDTKKSICHFLLEDDNHPNNYKDLGKVTYWPNTDFSKIISTSISPKTIVYQGIIYLIYRDLDNSGWYFINFDGQRWSFPTCFTKTNYTYSPGLAIHNGLLKVAFVGSTGNIDSISDRVIYQYCYDGNKWSSPVPSSDILAEKGINMASYKGKLFAVYPGIGTGGIINNSVIPHDES